MAEILGIISGIVAIADAGFKLYVALSSTASALGSAGTEMLLFSSEVRIFAEILVVVRASLQDQSLKTSRSDILDKAIGVVPGLIMQCEMVYASMERILSRLQPYKDSTFRLKSKIKWMQDKSKMLELRGFLEPLKSSLQLLLSLIKNEIADNNHEPAIIRTILREELKAAFLESRSQPESLDDGSVEIEGESTQIARLEHALVLRTKPMHTIKEAAEHMITLHSASPDLDNDLTDDWDHNPDFKGDFDKTKGKRRARDSEWTDEKFWPPQTSSDAIQKIQTLAEDTSKISQCATDGGQSETSSADFPMRNEDYPTWTKQKYMPEGDIFDGSQDTSNSSPIAQQRPSQVPDCDPADLPTIFDVTSLGFEMLRQDHDSIDREFLNPNMSVPDGHRSASIIKDEYYKEGAEYGNEDPFFGVDFGSGSLHEAELPLRSTRPMQPWGG